MDSVRRGSRPGRPLKYTLYSESVTIDELARIAGLSSHGVWYRLCRMKLTPEEVVEIPKKNKGRLQLNGRYASSREISRALYIDYVTLYRRAQRYGTTVQEEIDAEWRRQHEV